MTKTTTKQPVRELSDKDLDNVAGGSTATGGLRENTSKTKGVNPKKPGEKGIVWETLGEPI